MSRPPLLLFLTALSAWAVARTASAELPTHGTVRGVGVTTAEISGDGGRVGARQVSWASLAETDAKPGKWSVSFTVPAGAKAALVPACAGRKAVLLDDADVHASPGPLVVDLPADGRDHRVTLQLEVSRYEHRVACGAPPVVGVRQEVQDGLLPIAFASRHAAAGGGQAVVFIPEGHDVRRPAPLLVGLHPWNGSPWTYAAYEPLLSAARAADVLLLFPSGLGNSLYTEPAEDEVLTALRVACDLVSVDPDRVTIWGASMGGAGATTIGLHHPDLFAGVVSLFGDSKYDMSTYVRSILGDASGAHRVNALDIVDNARSLPVWLVHGEDDHVSPIAQSAMFARALGAQRFHFTFDRVPGAGHEGRVVTAIAPRIVALAATARRVARPARVTYWSVRPTDTDVYGVHLTRTRPEGDAFLDIERVGDAVHVRSAVGLRAIRLCRGALGALPTETPPVVVDDTSARGLAVEWEPAP